MGRFDALTNLEDTRAKNQTVVVAPSHSTEKEIEKPGTGLPANQQTSKLVNQIVDLPANQQTGKEINQQTSKTALSTKEKRKYSTYLREESIIDIQINAARAQKKDHELLQDIVDFYFERVNK